MGFHTRSCVSELVESVTGSAGPFEQQMIFLSNFQHKWPGLNVFVERRETARLPQTELCPRLHSTDETSQSCITYSVPMDPN